MRNIAGTHLTQATHGVPPVSRTPEDIGVKGDMPNVAGAHLTRATHGVPPASRIRYKEARP